MALDPGKRAQLGAHYTDREKILQLVEPVRGPEWERERGAVAAELECAEAARSRAARMKRRNEAERRYRTFLTRLREFTVLDPACGSGNFSTWRCRRSRTSSIGCRSRRRRSASSARFPEIGPANVRGIEVNPYAAELARVSVWIGEIQWMRRNGSRGGAQPDLVKQLRACPGRRVLVLGNHDLGWPALPRVETSPWTPSTASTEFRTEAIYPFLLSLLAVDAGGTLGYSPTGIAVPEVPEWQVVPAGWSLDGDTTELEAAACPASASRIRPGTEQGRRP